MTRKKPTEHWSVSVSRNGENLVTIESNMLAGQPEFSDEDARVIRSCAAHLLAFIGPAALAALPSEPPALPTAAPAPEKAPLPCPECREVDRVWSVGDGRYRCAACDVGYTAHDSPAALAPSPETVSVSRDDGSVMVRVDPVYVEQMRGEGLVGPFSRIQLQQARQSMVGHCRRWSPDAVAQCAARGSRRERHHP